MKTTLKVNKPKALPKVKPLRPLDIAKRINSGTPKHGCKAIVSNSVVIVSTKFIPHLCNLTIDGAVIFNQTPSPEVPAGFIDGADIIRLGRLLQDVYLK